VAVCLWLCVLHTCLTDLTGTIPTSMNLLPNLRHVFLSFNRLSGDLNATFCNRPTDPLQVSMQSSCCCEAQLTVQDLYWMFCTGALFMMLGDKSESQELQQYRQF
jgi:hypothetical protein